MKSTKTILSLLLLSSICATPALANYFSNSKWNTVLNIGSARSPTPEMLRRIGDSNYLPAARQPAVTAPSEGEDIDTNSYDEESRAAGGNATLAKNNVAVKPAAAKPVAAVKTASISTVKAKQKTVQTKAKAKTHHTVATNAKAKKQTVRG